MNGGRMMVFLVSIFYFAIAEGHRTLLNKCVHSLPSTPSLRLMVGCYCHHITPLLPYSLWRWKIEDNWPAIIEWITTVFMGLFLRRRTQAFLINSVHVRNFENLFFHRCLHLGNLQKKRLTSNIYLDDLQITSDYLMNHELRLKQLHYVLNTFDSGKKCQKVFF